MFVVLLFGIIVCCFDLVLLLLVMVTMCLIVVGYCMLNSVDYIHFFDCFLCFVV